MVFTHQKDILPPINPHLCKAITTQRFCCYEYAGRREKEWFESISLESLRNDRSQEHQMEVQANP